MSNKKYTPPKYGQEAFHCPHPGCGVYAAQIWFPEFNDVESYTESDSYLTFGCGQTDNGSDDTFRFNFCHGCGNYCLWVNEKLVYPMVGSAPLPNESLPKEVKDLYQEAAIIARSSPRASAALLRVALERLCDEYGKKGKTLSERARHLAEEKKLSHDVLEMMELIFKTGNKAAHPAEIDFNENPKIAEWLFELIDCVAEEIITAPTKTKQAAENLKRILEAAEKTGKK